MGSFASSLFSQPEVPAPGALPSGSNPDPPNPKVGSSEDPNPTTSSSSEYPEPDTSATEAEAEAMAEGSDRASEDPKPVTGVEATAADDDEEEEVGECGFCLFMKGGGCKDDFVEWEECIKAAESSGDDIAEKCFEITRKMRICMDAHPEYYEPILAMEKEMDKSISDAEESEKEVDVAAGAEMDKSISDAEESEKEVDVAAGAEMAKSILAEEESEKEVDVAATAPAEEDHSAGTKSEKATMQLVVESLV